DIENIEKTKKIINLAKKYDVLVEGEIGIIGGKEDDIINENSNFTSLKQAINFYQKTQVDFLAISVGSIHGEYKNKPNLQFDLIKEIKNNVNTFLVLHGSSGIELDDLKKAINAGIKKINIGTDLKIAYLSGIKKAIGMNTKDPKKISKIIISNIKDEILRKVKYLIS
ncbi:MAG: class II fructose-bisphosphate aldolase, partial [Mycoplasma sp.]|nr:class II fructose-bisphosphate aldolase [Mycoplasma sp.]